MGFIDPKECVMEVELTQYGKRLLSNGKFSPKYYAFFDDDILYDGRCFQELLEDQNDVSERIKTSPQIGAHYNFDGVESSFKRYKKIKMLEKDQPNLKMLEEREEENYFIYPIGTSDEETSICPANNILFLNGTITGSVTFLSSSVFPHLRVPQLNSDLLFNVFIGSSFEDMGLNNKDGEVDKKVYDDGSYISVEEDYLLLDLEEKNTNFEDENYDIEVYKVETDIADPNKERLIPLHFKTVEKKKNKLEKEEGLIRKKISLDDQDVEYYFDMFVDNEIDRDIICKARKNRKIKNIFVSEDRDCPDRKQLDKNIYKESKDDEEDCDF
ncbi:MAG: hypothetical protein Q8P81_02295 [Nanoarchaeota archaeon]|nr:hypothetical protein [Nanoarchaeota archaeon]